VQVNATIATYNDNRIIVDNLYLPEDESGFDYAKPADI